MLIKVKNSELYNDWISYYEKYCSDMKPFEIRTFAFINSNKGETPPISFNIY